VKKKLYFISLSLFSLLLISCGGKPQAVGSEDEIIVIADSSDYLRLEASLYETFSKVIYTPQAENLFELTRRPYEQLPQVKGTKNVLLIGTLGGKGLASQYVMSLLDSTVTDMVKRNEEFVFNKHDLWANGQLVMIMAGSNLDELEKKILTEKESLLHHFKKASNKRLAKRLYNPSFEQKDVQGRFLRDYGWIIFVPNDAKLAKDAADDNFVWIRRGHTTDMERWVFVHWIENASPELLNADSISGIRNSLTSKYYKKTNDAHVIIANDQAISYEEVNFLDRYAIMANGFWRFSDKSGGGPYISYTFYDEDTKRIYMLDGSIFAPKYYKKKLIQQIDVTLQSFLTKDELTPKRYESLVDAIVESAEDSTNEESKL
jgi:hypothetical protein